MFTIKQKLQMPRRLPRVARFEKLGFGLFLHWGLYSQLGAGEWAMWSQQIPPREYNQLQNSFTAEDFDAGAWARLAKATGMKYITLTARHHEGFSLYDTRGLSTLDALHSPARRDLVKEFVAACRAEGIIPFLYHTTIDWQWWKGKGWPGDGGPNFAKYVDYLYSSVEILCKHYGELGGFWFDGNWGHPEADWNEDRLYAMIRSYQPQAVIINNSGLDARGAKGHPEIDSTTFEQGLPTFPDQRGWKKYLAGEMSQTMNRHWGIAVEDFEYLSPTQMIENLCLSRKAGANYLLNLGPTAHGGIPEYEAAALRKVGSWVSHYGTALAGRPVRGIHCGGRDFILQDGSRFYYFAFNLAIKGNDHVTVTAGLPGPRAVVGLKAKISSAKWLDSGEELGFAQNLNEELFSLNCTEYAYGYQHVVRVAELSAR